MLRSPLNFSNKKVLDNLTQLKLNSSMKKIGSRQFINDSMKKIERSSIEKEGNPSYVINGSGSRANIVHSSIKKIVSNRHIHFVMGEKENSKKLIL